ncbi:GNAT family N-acetyltransferase [Brachybacterium squillarum]|uniref:GNAT family N-acetyltransferase n=1 Tax=Brachybacterium squillarum TaxID=661979 RepID=UPI0002629FDA|nr:GNAT family N-acetyltransferase [Brachybacterium squillarum]
MRDTRSSSADGGELSTPVVLGLADAGEVLTLQRAAYLTEAAAHHDFSLPPLTQTLAELEEELTDSAVTALGIRVVGRLVGAVRVRRAASVVELGRLIVAPDWQGHGVGTRLLLRAETVHPEASEMRLFTGEHSTANIRLYTRHGYHETRRTPAGSYHLVHFAKVLPSR